MGKKKQVIRSEEGNMAFTFIYRTYLDFVSEGEETSGFDFDKHSWIEKEYKTFRRKRANAIKGLELNKEFSRAYPDIKRNAFHLEKIGQLNWGLEKKLNDRNEYKDYSIVLAEKINQNNVNGLIVSDVWDYVTPLMRQYREFEIDKNTKSNIELLKRNTDLKKRKEVIDKALEFIVTRRGAMKKFNLWLENS